MVVENKALVLDLLEWINTAPRSYRDLMSVWRTSCPRLTIWEDALDASFVRVNGRGVVITAEGIEFLEKRRGPAELGRSPL